MSPKKGINPIILLWGWDWDHQTYSREGYGSLGIDTKDGHVKGATFSKGPSFWVPVSIDVRFQGGISSFSQLLGLFITTALGTKIFQQGQQHLNGQVPVITEFYRDEPLLVVNGVISPINGVIIYTCKMGPRPSCKWSFLALEMALLMGSWRNNP